MVPRAPVSGRAQAEPSAQPGMSGGPCLSKAPTGWAAFGSLSQKAGKWCVNCCFHRELLGDSCCRGQGAQGQGQGKGLDPCSWEKPRALSTGVCSLTGLFATGNVGQCGASSVPEPAHGAPLLEGCEWSSPKKHPEVLTGFATSFTKIHFCFAFRLMSGA